ncbi:glycosyltransferase family 2 protein [Cryobacterium sp. TMT1-21]|uniref:Glycosyltransferase family 2 protein n=1 Tax=Cryobacterium shii TaxID=1259235 RepID=A0AAQ2C5L0_9MICO|nr:glycosyltransferase family 2 protein [Cryobacterium shii]TFC89620.1 glycosyltransferase family 2 protein [Cryobacterium sp. TmT2-59]TFD16866.1 glycosyltransferase family 2 protein [Cryobacterium sp. TMT1-21]
MGDHGGGAGRLRVLRPRHPGRRGGGKPELAPLLLADGQRVACALPLRRRCGPHDRNCRGRRSGLHLGVPRLDRLPCDFPRSPWGHPSEIGRRAPRIASPALLRAGFRGGNSRADRRISHHVQPHVLTSGRRVVGRFTACRSAHPCSDYDPPPSFSGGGNCVLRESARPGPPCPWAAGWAHHRDLRRRGGSGVVDWPVADVDLWSRLRRGRCRTRAVDPRRRGHGGSYPDRSGRAGLRTPPCLHARMDRGDVRKLRPSYDSGLVGCSGHPEPVRVSSDRDSRAWSWDSRRRRQAATTSDRGRNVSDAPRPVRFSVVMPAFNSVATIGRAIRSVLAQTEMDWELLIVDDSSTDRTVDAVRELMIASPEAQIRLIVQTENRGVAAARNAGLAHATGDYVTFLDSDDEYLHDHLAIFAAELTPEIDIVIGGREIVRTDGSVDHAASRGIGVWSGREAVRQAMLDRLTPFPWDKVFRRSLFDTVRFPEGAARFEDMVTNIVLYSHARMVKAVATPTYRYFISGQSLTWGRVPTLADTTVALDYLATHLRHEFTVGMYANPLRSMRTLISLLVAQTAISRGHTSAEARNSVRQCRRAVRVPDVWATLRAEPRLGIAALLFKTAPSVYTAAYRRHVKRAFGMTA